MHLFGKRYHPPGTSPGTLVQRLKPTAVRFRVVDYSASDHIEHDFGSLAECEAYFSKETVTWIHVQGNADPETLGELGRLLNLHALALEDTLNTGQRPKFEVYGDHAFVVLHRPVLSGNVVSVEQVSLFAGARFVVSFHDGAEDPFEAVRDRLRRGVARYRAGGSDYLLYALLDLIVDEGFPMLEDLGEQIEDLEEQLVKGPSREALGRIHQIKRELLLLRRMLWPQREAVSGLLRGELELIRRETHVYLRDCYDHTIQVMDLIETYREMTASLLDMYMSGVSNRLNDIMRVLTIIATLFIPLSFITGIYGMNFENPASPWAMPELRWYYGYPLFWLIIAVTALGMLVFFKRRKWW